MNPLDFLQGIFGGDPQQQGPAPMSLAPPMQQQQMPMQPQPQMPEQDQQAFHLFGNGGMLSPNLLMGLGAGIASGGNLGESISKGLTGAMSGRQEDQKLAGNNQTIRALQAKGVDAQTLQAAVYDPNLMKTLITKHFGGKEDTDLIRNFEYSKEHPELLQFSQSQKASDANKVVPAGGAYIDSSGKVLYSNKPSALFDDETTASMAQQYLAGDKSVLQNLGRGAQGAESIAKLRTEIHRQAVAQGMKPTDIASVLAEYQGQLAGQRAVGTRAANISLAANEANNMIPIALDASAKLPRTQWMPWNQAVQTVQKGSSSPELASFVAATNSLVNSYVRAVSPTGVPTDAMRQHAYDMLNTAQDDTAYQAVVNTMQQEMNAALQAPGQVKKELRGQPSGSHQKSNTTSNGMKWSVE